ncbi:hypothetical protein DICPUDRAFT_155241 [Dictyostelium purpureum]|uniref:Uncharacterized protein n=1 Tax=Dictyostelium purpureum TaxID=5786 RepID=F0ZTF8_DICPU|nr:uncharacterized protein DICPUDRAFT_155241 [Dictyostelium purpureum]EGC32775.1 hypothetical protein DICPUDRAFT_155241 [Dictyostelium purpureum]|eukprot:XP_003290698.1 hypothetical protein DICPUDRAFT_155241 [Dictyostelium purpureum]
MKIGEVVEDTTNGNSFIYFGNHRMGGDGTSRCKNYCFQANPKTNYITEDIEFLVSYDYYCRALWRYSYTITIEDSSVSSSTNNKPTILLGLSILLIMFGLYI